MSDETPVDQVLTKDGEPHPQPHLKRFEFKPGQSGNPSGRPPGARSFAEIVAKILDETVSAEVVANAIGDVLAEGADITRRELAARIFLDEALKMRNTRLLTALLDREYPTPQGDAAASLAGSVKSWVEIVRERAAELDELEAGELVELECVK